MTYKQHYDPPPKYTLGGGISLELRNESEFLLFSDIFINNEYGPGFKDLVETHDKTRTANIVDLGANVGFFSWYAASAMLVHQIPYQLTLVEGHPVVYCELMRRLSEVQLPAKAYCGLVGGKTEGYGVFCDNGGHHTLNRIPQAKEVPEGHCVVTPHMNVQYLNPYDILPHDDFIDDIDLLKVDIEGAEFSLIEHQLGVFKATKRLLIEIHHDQDPDGRWLEQLESYGLREVHTRTTGQVSTQFWKRS